MLLPTGAQSLEGGLKVLVRWDVDKHEEYVPVEALMARRQTACAALTFLMGKITVKGKPRTTRSGGQTCKP